MYNIHAFHYAHIHVCIYIYVYICIHMYFFIYIYACACIHMSTSMYMYIICLQSYWICFFRMPMALDQQIKELFRSLTVRQTSNHMHIYIYSIALRILPGQPCASCFIYDLFSLHIYATSWVTMCSDGDLRDLWGCPGLAGGSIWGPWEVPGGVSECLGGPWGPWASLRLPWGSPGWSWGGPWESVGCPWECLEGCWGVPGRPWGSPGIPQDCPRTPQGASLDALVGAMGALKNIETLLFLLHFQHCEALGSLGGSLVVTWRCLGCPWASLGRPWADGRRPWSVPGGSRRSWDLPVGSSSGCPWGLSGSYGTHWHTLGIYYARRFWPHILHVTKKITVYW